MNSAKKAVHIDDTKYSVIKGDDGHFYVDPLDSGGKYLVRKYDIPEINDLKSYKDLLHDFQQRLLRNVSRGDTVSSTSVDTLDNYIEHERSVLTGLQKKCEAFPADVKLQDEAALSKRWLATALVARAMRLSKFHIQKRIDAHHDNPDATLHQEVKLDDVTVQRLSNALLGDIKDPAPADQNYKSQKEMADKERENIQQLASRTADSKKHPHPHLELIDRCISRDSMEVLGLGADLRNKRGHKGSDDHVGEMQGEPLKIFISSKSGAPDLIQEIFDLRYLKIARAMRSIDNAVGAVEKLSRYYPEIQQSLKTMEQMAKQKIQIVHNDSGYRDVDRAYIIARDKTHELLEKVAMDAVNKAGGIDLNTGRLSKSNLGRISSHTQGNVALDMMALRQAAETIYEIALTRERSDTEVALLALASENLTKQRARSK